MNPFIVLLVSFLPGALWLAYFYRKDVYEPEPVGYVLKAFIYGVLAVIPVGMVEAPFQGIIERPPDILTFFVVAVVVIGFTEEFGKFLAVRLAVFSKKEIDEVVDGVVYGVSAGLGFSAAENFVYVAAFGLQVGVIRAVVTSVAHASFSGIVGYFYGRAVVEKDLGHVKVIKGLAIAAVLHGVYDFLVMSGFVSPVLLTAIILGLYYYLVDKISYALSLSKYRPRG